MIKTPKSGGEKSHSRYQHPNPNTQRVSALPSPPPPPPPPPATRGGGGGRGRVWEKLSGTGAYRGEQVRRKIIPKSLKETWSQRHAFAAKWQRNQSGVDPWSRAMESASDPGHGLSPLQDDSTRTTVRPPLPQPPTSLRGIGLHRRPTWVLPRQRRHQREWLYAAIKPTLWSPLRVTCSFSVLWWPLVTWCCRGHL